MPTRQLARATLVASAFMLAVLVTNGANHAVLAQSNVVDPEARLLFEQAVSAAIANARTGNKDAQRLIGVPPPLIARLMRTRRTLEDRIAEFVRTTFHGSQLPASLSSSNNIPSQLTDWVSIVRDITRSAEMGYAPAQFLVPRITRATTAERRDRVAWNTYRFNWVRRAAEQDYAPALLELGEYYYLSAGTPEDVVKRDEVKALSLIQQAAEADFGAAQAFLGRVHAKQTFLLETAIPIDRIKALKWLEIAATNGVGTAATRSDLAFYMTRVEIGEARRQARNWLAARSKPSELAEPAELRSVDSSRLRAGSETSVPSSCSFANATASKISAGSSELELNRNEDLAAFARHVAGDIPSQGPGEALYSSRYYLVMYDPGLRAPVWSYHRIDSIDLRPLRSEPAFHTDPRLKAFESAKCEDYEGSQFVPGLMASSKLITRTDSATISTYALTNTAPRACTLDKGLWHGIEIAAKHWAMLEGTIFVTTGAIFDHNDDGRRDPAESMPRLKASGSENEGIAIPSHFYKIYQTFGTSKVLAIAVRNTPGQTTNAEFASVLDASRVPLSWIEQRTGLSFIESRGSRDSLREIPKYRDMWDIIHPLWPLPEGIDIETGLLECRPR